MQLWVGTSGYSYKEWKGSFYPEKLPASRMLAYYAERLPAVEINNTFYRLPKPSVLESWASQVPAAFRFAVKASRRITHMKRLVDAGDETGFLLRSVESLGERLGALLFQLPPTLRLDLPRLERFVELLPAGTPAAFEFRHASWREPAVRDLLRARGFAWCDADMDEEPAAELAGGERGYLRLRRSDYSDADLADWALRVRSRGWSQACVFFKHEDAGAGPRLAARFLALASETPERPRVAPVRPRRGAGEREAG
jgi:uncharacterized protein YecE (DUF72 family)